VLWAFWGERGEREGGGEHSSFEVCVRGGEGCFGGGGGEEEAQIEKGTSFGLPQMLRWGRAVVNLGIVRAVLDMGSSRLCFLTQTVLSHYALTNTLLSTVCCCCCLRK
jgi:hypothetical protein